MTTLRAEYLDCCLPDYFQGSGADEVLAVPVWSNMTYSDAQSALQDEWRSGGDSHLDNIEGIDSIGSKAINELFESVSGSDVADFVRYVEPADDDDCCETVHLYVGIFQN